MRSDLEPLGANAWFLTHELVRRGVEVAVIDAAIDAFEASFQGHRELLVSLHSRLVPHSLVRIAEDKYVVKTLLRRAGLTVPEGERFKSQDVRALFLYAAEIGYPLVLKPCVGSGGDRVQLDVGSLGELDEAADRFFRGAGPEASLLVERQVEGAEHRVLITQRGEYAVVHRDPAHVIGDGRRSIEELARAESYRRTHPPHQNCLRAIPLDPVVARHLARSGRSLATVPAPQEKVYLRRNSNVITGAMAEDVTERVHPSVIDLCRQALAALEGLAFAGIDFVSADISRPHQRGDYFILEVNTNPAVGIHIRPGKGKGRDVVRPIADLLFPETAAGPASPGPIE